MSIRMIPPLYKYLSFKGILRFLKAPSFRFTQPKFLNDPYESHLSIDTEQVLDNYQTWRMKQDESITSDEAKKIAQGLEEQLVTDALLNYRNIRNSLGVLSLTANPKNLLMWAHYGVNHTGVVLEL